MKIESLMTPDVVTVRPEASLKDVAAILVERRVSGLPVCDAKGRVVGVISEADIVAKECVELDHGLLARKHGEATTAGEAMTAPALCAPPETSVAKAAKLMLKCRVNRLPVVADGTLVGIVTRADLVRAFHRSDDEIERELRGDVLEHTLWLDPAGVDVGVEDGVVTLTGVTDTRTTARLVETLARRVPGVVAVESRLEWRFDDRNVHASRSSLTP